MRCSAISISMVLESAFLLFVFASSPAQTREGGARQPQPAAGRPPVVYVMPNALATPGSGDASQVVVASGHEGKEPQVAKIYQELQHRKECAQFSETIDKSNADYFLLLQHGGGVGNRWVVSNKEGTVKASGESMRLVNSVKDACIAIAKDWQGR